MSRRIFFWVEGQEHNLGDSVLRRGMFNAVRTSEPLHVYVGACGPEYLSSFTFEREDVLYRSLSSWYLAALRSSLLRKTHLFMSAGEAIADRRSIPMRVANTLVALSSSLKRGGVYQAGVGLRKPKGRFLLPLKMNARAASFVSWRDSWSRDQVGVGSVTPDWAVLEGTSDPELAKRTSGNRLTVSIRGDKQWPTPAWRFQIGVVAESLALRPTFVSQVEVDNDLAQSLADEFGGDVVLWDGSDHKSLEDDLRVLYSESRFVVSDRLHVLILALTEGAVPVAAGAREPEKSIRTLRALGISEIDIDLAAPSESVVSSFEALATRRSELLEALKNARVAARRTASALTQRVMS
ncbi:polysaccharide pyruvyl transferase family protein [Pseudoclavibacter terrae]|uniref:polysaccharide pyruvyl transferase family protein n=1 Tax=Pseudoclavibacter terrae TaxID=1530195 RepID=UPI00232BCEB9|nr:polysaccharide pyruvyl transferase family protein [Pseudoclavibacter terrae]